MKKLVTDRGWTAHSHHVKAMLGLDVDAHLPAAGLAPQILQGIKVWVAPLDPARSHRRVHRVRAECPDCQKEMSAGRLHQHVCR